MNKDKKLVIKFLGDIQADLELIIENIYLLAPKRKDFIRILIESWERVIPAFVEIKEKINEISSDTLVKVGLNGHQLVLKYQTYKTARAKFRSSMETFNQLRENNMKEIIDSVLSLSKTINIILNGLSAGIPQVYAVKGFKEAIVDIISVKAK